MSYEKIKLSNKMKQKNILTSFSDCLTYNSKFANTYR